MIDLSNFFVLIQSVRTTASGAAETLQLVLGMARTKPICCVARPAIKGFLKIVTQSLCTPIIAGKPFNALFWLLPSVTVSGGQQESFRWTKMALIVLCLKLATIAKKYWKSSFEIYVSMNVKWMNCGPL